MERIAGDFERFHLSPADLDALLIAAHIEGTFDSEAGLGCGGTDQLDHGKTICERPAAPWQNSRCSILFHFDVPGG